MVEGTMQVRLTRTIIAMNGTRYLQGSIVNCNLVKNAAGVLKPCIIAANHEGPVLFDNDWQALIPDRIESG